MEEQHKNIDKYLDGEMTPDEVMRFEKQMQTDDDLAEEVRMQEDMRSAYSEHVWFKKPSEYNDDKEVEQLTSFFESEETSELKQTIKESMSDSKETVVNRMPWFIGIAAAVIGLMAIMFIYFPSKSSLKGLYGQYMSINDLPTLITRGEGNYLMAKGQLSFVKGDYSEAISYFERSNKEENDINPIVYIYLGISHLEQNQFELALSEFEKLKNSNALEAARADWYMAMVYLKKEDRTDLLKILERITLNEQNYKFQEAKKLFEQVQ